MGLAVNPPTSRGGSFGARSGTIGSGQFSRLVGRELRLVTCLALGFLLELFLFFLLFSQFFLTFFVSVVGCCQSVLSLIGATLPPRPALTQAGCCFRGYHSGFPAPAIAPTPDRHAMLRGPTRAPPPVSRRAKAPSGRLSPGCSARPPTTP